MTQKLFAGSIGIFVSLLIGGMVPGAKVSNAATVFLPQAPLMEHLFYHKIFEPDKKADKLRSEKISVKKGKLPRGGSFYKVLRREGLGHEDIVEMSRALKPIQNMGRVPSGTPYEIMKSNKKVLGLSFEVEKQWIVSVLKNGDSYTTGMSPIPYETEIVSKGGVIKSNLYETIKDMGERAALGQKLTDVFAWEVNFFRDIKPGDQVKVVVEKKSRKGKFVRYGRLLAAELLIRGKNHQAIYFDKKKEYYTPEGKSLKKQFLKVPLRYSRISSRFSPRRFHPILKRRMPHWGVDYAAPRGTPVYSVADGKVIFASRKGPSGNLVKIRHNAVYTTAYLHLSAYGPGIKKGVKVKQGQLIGRVGSTGRSTGPHLDFQIKKYGKPIDPLKFEPPQASPIPPKLMASFQLEKRRLMAKLEFVEIGEKKLLAQNSNSVSGSHQREVAN